MFMRVVRYKENDKFGLRKFTLIGFSYFAEYRNINSYGWYLREPDKYSSFDSIQDLQEAYNRYQIWKNKKGDQVVGKLEELQ